MVNKIKGGTYSDKQSCSLNPEENSWFQKLQNEERKKKSDKDKYKEHRRHKAARSKSECKDASGEDNTTQEPTSNAGAQFGSNGNRNKKRDSELHSVQQVDVCWICKVLKMVSLE